EFFAVNHSIPDSLAVAIRTGAGLVLHTGDFKMDQLPLDGRLTDLGGFARLGAAGIDLLLADSTNAEVPGFVSPERSIGPVLDSVVQRATRRVIVACFASHVHRVQQVLDSAAAMAPDKVVLISTGSQGEPLSALARMANREHPQVRIEPADTVILAS